MPTTEADIPSTDSLPDALERTRDVELTGRWFEVWARRAGLLLLTGVAAAGLANVFGQRPSKEVASSDAAVLQLTAPAALRSGLVFQVLVRIDAVRTLAQPALVLDPSWVGGMTLNSVEPEALRQSERDGRLVLGFDRVPAGSHLTVRLQFQVNPTVFGRRSEALVLEDGGLPLARIARTVTIFP